MDILAPLDILGNDVAVGDGQSLGVSRVFMRISTVKGERPYRPDYGLTQPIFLTPQQYPITVEDVLLELSHNEGTLNYVIS